MWTVAGYRSDLQAKSVCGGNAAFLSNYFDHLLVYRLETQN